MGHALTEMALRFKWMDMALLYNDDSVQRKCHHIRLELDAAVQNIKRKEDRLRVWSQFIQGSPTEEQIDNFLTDVRSNARSQSSYILRYILFS